MERPEICKDLFDVLQMKVFLTEKEARRYFAQILEANINCEENGVIHRDLKPENILLDMRDDAIKLIDFGLASEVQDEPFNTFRGEKWRRYFIKTRKEPSSQPVDTRNMFSISFRKQRDE